MKDAAERPWCRRGPPVFKLLVMMVETAVRTALFRTQGTGIDYRCGESKPEIAKTTP